MASIQEQLQTWATRNAELVSILADTDHAPTALTQQNDYIKELENEAKKLDKEIGAAIRKRESEHKDHTKYQESILKKFSYKAVGKKERFEEKAQKEEREYFDALQDEHNAKERKRHIDQQLHEAHAARAEIETSAKRHDQAQTELDHLYNSIFSGPTPDLPQEDQSEHKAGLALDQYRQTRAKWENEDQALRLLSDASKAMGDALQAIEAALSHSRMDMWGGGSMIDMMERSELSRAQALTSTVYMLYGQAQRSCPQIQNIPRMEIDQGHLMSDVFFDNVFTDMAQHDRIKNSQGQMQRGFQHLRNELENCKARVNSLREVLRQEEQTLLAARQELQRVRQQAFEDFARPPAYS